MVNLLLRFNWEIRTAVSTETERAANTNFNIIVPKALITFPFRSAIVGLFSPRIAPFAFWLL